jgi:hypothetical protein
LIHTAFGMNLRRPTVSLIALVLLRLMGGPYGRIAPLHSPVPLLCVMVLWKIALDVRAHVRAHRGGVG